MSKIIIYQKQYYFHKIIVIDNFVKVFYFFKELSINVNIGCSLQTVSLIFSRITKFLYEETYIRTKFYFNNSYRWKNMVTYKDTHETFKTEVIKFIWKNYLFKKNCLPYIPSWFGFTNNQIIMGASENKIKYFDGSEYQGGVNSEGKEHGEGRILYANGDKL